MSDGIKWFDEHGVTFPKPMRKIKEDDFHFKRFAYDDKDELHSVIFQRPNDGAWLYITCWHNEVTVSISNPVESRLYVRIHEVCDDYEESYTFWKKMAYEAVLYPHVCSNIYNDYENKLAKKLDVDRFTEMHSNWNEYVLQPYNYSHEIEWWENRRTV